MKKMSFPVSGVALGCTLLPFLAIHASWLMSSALGYIEWGFPYVDGSTSISRAARRGDTVFLFRILMMPYAVLLALYWLLVRAWFKNQVGDWVWKQRAMFASGILGASTLLVYVNFLGTSGEVYQFLRRFGVIFYFAGSGIAEILFADRLLDLGKSSALAWQAAKWKLSILGVMLLLAVLQALLPFFLVERDSVNNIIEWNFALLLHLLFLVSYWLWRKTDFRIETTLGVQS